jgi:hypothetical protein
MLSRTTSRQTSPTTPRLSPMEAISLVKGYTRRPISPRALYGRRARIHTSSKNRIHELLVGLLMIIGFWVTGLEHQTRISEHWPHTLEEAVKHLFHSTTEKRSNSCRVSWVVVLAVLSLTQTTPPIRIKSSISKSPKTQRLVRHYSPGKPYLLPTTLNKS